MKISPPFRASPPFTPFHPFVNRVGVKGCACIKSSMLGNETYKGNSGYITLWGAEEVLSYYGVIIASIQYYLQQDAWGRRRFPSA